VGVSNVAIVDRAQVPNRPSAPSLPVNLALALLFGTLLAAAAVFALEQIDEGVKDPSQVRRQIGLPLLGSVPDIVDQDVVDMLRDPKSAASEAYFTIRSNLGFSTDHGFPRSLLITSTREAEGKSTASLGIATVLGRSGSKVLLIDADMRSPSIHGMLGLTNEEGLSNVLSGGNNLDRMIRETSARNVWLLSAGPVPPSAAELLAGNRIVELVREMEQRFDHVIVDSAPLLGLADAPLVARAVEGSAYVVESGGVAARGVRASIDRLRSARRPVFGIILSRLTAANASYGYGYGYSYGYGDRDSAPA
jgi:capsular exopolysaccharide synthesis family protein